MNPMRKWMLSIESSLVPEPSQTRFELFEKYSRDTGAFQRYMRDEKFDPYAHWYLVCEWIENNDLLDEISSAAGEEISSQDELQEHDPELFYKLSPQNQKDCAEWVVDYLLQHDPAEAPTHAYMSLERQKLLPRNTWLVHFTDAPWDIASQGFKYGVDQMDRLGLTTYFKNEGQDKRYGGFNFAFLADGRDALYAARGGKYGKSAVMFQNSGTLVYHSGDGERQVVFHGSDVDPREIVVLTNDGGDWQVRSHTATKRDDILFTGDFSKCVAWVEKNFRQYQSKLIKK